MNAMNQITPARPALGHKVSAYSGGLLFLLLFLVQVSVTQAQIRMQTYDLAFLNDLKALQAEASKTIEPSEEFKSKYPLYKDDKQEWTIGALLKIENPVVFQQLKAISVHTGSIAGKIASVSVPLASVENLMNLQGIHSVQFNRKAVYFIDEVRTDCRINEVHQGLNLPAAYLGKDVVVGVIDISFDFSHPTFQGADSLRRIRKVWDQTARTTRPPTGYNYGSEWSKIDQIKLLTGDDKPTSHGTHTAGIAAGRGEGIGTAYCGVAPAADLVLVSMDNVGNQTIDAINYIFAYAVSVNKPAVINMSFGIFDGPRDGSSLFEEALEALIGPGHILVGATGNSGQLTMHLVHDQEGDTLNTILYGNAQGFSFGDEFVEFWADSTSEFSVGMSVLDPAGIQVGQTSRFYNFDSLKGNESWQWTGSLFANVSAKFVALKANRSINGKKTLRIEMTNRNFSHHVVLNLINHKGSVVAWNNGSAQGGVFADTLRGGAQLSDYTKGDTLSNMGVPGGTCDAVISVGAYTTKNKYTNLEGEELEIRYPAELYDFAPFTSRGPTADGRIKPDIMAPGNVVASALNSYDNPVFIDPSIFVHEVRFNNRPYRYGVYEGTSMASPVVAGTVALMLEAYPVLSAAKAKEILRETARKDDFTGPIPTSGDNLWGRGKLDAYAAVQAAYKLTGRQRLQTGSHSLRVFPQPSTGACVISSTKTDASIQSVEILSLNGQVVRTYSSEISSSEMLVPRNDLAAGCWILRVHVQSGNRSQVEYAKLLLVD